ncbi:unnamed protein product [Amaranthus hypochondriacus]
MKLDGGFLELLAFTNEDNELVTFQVAYDWKPLVCNKCKQIEHERDHCELGVTRQWVPKVTQVVPTTHIEAPGDTTIVPGTADSALGNSDVIRVKLISSTSDDPPACEDVFLMVRGRSKSRYDVGEGSKPTAETLLSTINGFEVLAEHDTHPNQALGAISHLTDE